MKFDPKTVRALGRLTDQMNLMRKHPHRYEMDAKDLEKIALAAAELEQLLARVKTIPVG